MKYSGFILKDFLISLLIIMLVFPIVIEVLNVVSNFKYIDYRLQNEISLIHMSKRLIIANDILVNSDSLSYKYDNKEWTLKFSDDRLYLTPGYQLILDEIDDGYFYTEDNLVYVVYIKDEKEYEKVLTII